MGVCCFSRARYRYARRNRKPHWLNFRGRRYFPATTLIFFAAWIAVIAIAYAQTRNLPEAAPVPAVLDLQKKLASALRERDIAISERDSVRRAQGDTTPRPIPPIPPSMQADEIEERIDAWKGVKGQMAELATILNDGDVVIENWRRDDSVSIANSVTKFREEYEGFRSRLSSLLNVNSQFSDLNVINIGETNKLSTYIYNLQNELSRTPKKAALEPYVMPILRQIKMLKQWTETSRRVADSSILDLSDRQK